MRRRDREVTDPEQIKKILAPIKTCHLAMVDGGKPYVVPLSHGYTLDEDMLTIYFHSAKEGRKIEVLRKNSAVCFEMSTEGQSSFEEATPCDFGYYFSSVIGFGNAQFIEDIEEKCMALTIITKHQADTEYKFTEMQANTVCVFKVSSTDFCGKLKPGRGG